MKLTAGVSYVSYVIEAEGEAAGAIPAVQPRLVGLYDSYGQLIGGAGYCGKSFRLEFATDSNGPHYIAIASFGPYMPNRSTLPVGTYVVSASSGS